MDLDTIMKITNNATKEPWRSWREGRDFDSGSSIIMTGKDDDRDYDIESDMMKVEDQDFIAMARNVVPELVEEILRLRKILSQNSIQY